MKKLLSLLTLMLFLFAGKTIAQVTIPEGSTSENPTYYVLRSYRSGNYMSVGSDGTPNQNSTITINCVWSFIGSTSDGVFSGNIQNYAYKGSETPYLFRNSNNAYSLTDDGMTWYVKANPYPTDAPEGVVISSNINLGQNTCIDESGGAKLGVWNPSSNDWQGTTWVISSVEDLYNESITKVRTVLSTKGWGGYPVDAAYETLEQTFNAIDIPTTPDEYISSLEKIDEALSTFYTSSDVNKLEDGYYRFECQNTNNNGKYNTYFRPNIFGSFPQLGENIIVREPNKETPSQATIWYLEAQNEEKTEFTFRNAATGEYLSNKMTNSMITTSPIPSNITIVYKHKDKAGNLAIKGNDFTMFLNEDQVINYWDGIGSVWCAIPVNAAGVKLSNGYYRFLCKNSGDNNNYFRVNTLGGYENQPKNIIVREPDKANPTLASVWYIESVNPEFTQYTFRNAQTGEYLNNQPVSDKFGTSKTPCTLFVRYGVFDGTDNEGCVQIENKASSFTLFLNNEYASSWTGSDGPGTAWEPIAIDESNLNQYINEELANQISDYYTAQRNAYDKVYFGINDYNVSGATEEKAALDATLNFANYHAYTTKVTDPKEDAIYYIVSTYSSFTDGKTRAIYFDENVNNPKWKICDHNEAPMLWKLARYTDDNNLDGYTIYNANNGKHIQGAGWSGTCSWRNDAYAWSILASSAGAGETGTNVNIVHFLASDKQTLALSAKNNTNAQPGLDETNNTLTGYNNFDAPYATQWQIIEAENVDLKTNLVNGEYWGTAYLPAAIKLPEGARGFYVSSTTNGTESSEANLTEVADGIVPAENGALIYSDNADENGYITASIVYNSEIADLEGNLLQGSLAGTNVPENGYILTRKDSHGLGFYKINPDNSKIAGNKAYLVPQAGISLIQAYSFKFDGNSGATTNIENTVTNENTPKVYYDLQGRRVINPNKGIYITSDGKKVIFNK